MIGAGQTQKPSSLLPFAASAQARGASGAAQAASAATDGNASYAAQADEIAARVSAASSRGAAQTAPLAATVPAAANADGVPADLPNPLETPVQSLVPLPAQPAPLPQGGRATPVTLATSLDSLHLPTSLTALAGIDATAVAPAVAGVVRSDVDDTVPLAPPSAADAALSQQMLALLAGSLSIIAPAAQPSAPPAVDAAPDLLAGARVATPMPGLPLSTAGNQAAAPDAAMQGGVSALLTDFPALPAATSAAAPELALRRASDGVDDGTNAVAEITSLTASPLTGTSPLATAVRSINPVTATPLAVPANADAGFDDGFGARIAWMAEQKLGHAEIRLNPEHAGPIDVRIHLDGSRVAAEFHSANADVRQALEASLPRLRELLGQHGLQLGQADIGQRQGQHAQSTRRHDSDSASHGDAGGPDTTAAPAARIMRSRGLLDEYA